MDDIVVRLRAGDLCDLELAPKAAAEIEHLRSQLAARDGEIADWLRAEAAKVIGVITSIEGYDTAKAELQADIIETAADMIERGKYRNA